jgi:large subunit ribosomal protein L29
MAKSSELRNLGDTELVRKLVESREELFNLRFQNVTGQLDNSSRIGVVRKDIARLQTIMRQREIELHESGEKASNG